MLPEFFYTINFTLVLLFASFGILSSLTTILIVIKYRKFHTFNHLLGSNSCVAVIFFLLLEILRAVYALREDWQTKSPLCSFRAYAYNVGIAAICYSNPIHAISHLFYAVFYKYRFLLTWRTHWILISVAWLISILVCLPPFFVQGGYALEEESRSCVLSSKMSLLAFYMLTVSSMIPLNIIIIIYIAMVIHVHRSSYRVRAFNSNVNGTTHRAKREIKMVRTMLLHMNIFAVGGMPFLILTLWQVVQRSPPPPEPLYLLAFSLISITISVSPAIYFFANPQLIEFVRDYFRNQKPAVGITKAVRRQQQTRF